MGKEKKYYIRMETGQEFGPYEEERIIALAKDGKIMPGCLIRSEYVMSWEKAEKVKFLRKTFIPILEKQAMAGKDTDWEKFKRRINLRGDEMPENKIAQEGFSFAEATIWMRTLGALLDIVFIVSGAVPLALACHALKKLGLVSPEAFPYLNVVVGCTWLFFYFVWSWCHQLQTYGQRVFGLVLIRNDRTPIYPCRAACYFFLMMIFGIFSPVTELLTLNHGTFQEFLTGTSVMRLTRSR